MLISDWSSDVCSSDLEIGIHRKQRVVDEIAVVARDVGCGPDGIEVLQVRMGDHPEHGAALCARPPPQHRDPQGERDRGGRGRKELALGPTLHVLTSLFDCFYRSIELPKS